MRAEDMTPSERRVAEAHWAALDAARPLEIRTCGHPSAKEVERSEWDIRMRCQACLDGFVATTMPDRHHVELWPRIVRFRQSYGTTESLRRAEDATACRARLLDALLCWGEAIGELDLAIAYGNTLTRIDNPRWWIARADAPLVQVRADILGDAAVWCEGLTRDGAA